MSFVSEPCVCVRVCVFVQSLEPAMQREAANAVLSLEKKIRDHSPVDCEPQQPTKTVYLGAQVRAHTHTNHSLVEKPGVRRLSTAQEAKTLEFES